MALDDVINGAAVFKVIEGIDAALNKDSEDLKAYDTYVNYLTAVRGYAPAHAQNFVRGSDGLARRIHSRMHKKEDQRSLAGFVEPKYDEVIAAISEEDLSVYAIEMQGPNKDYLEMEKIKNDKTLAPIEKISKFKKVIEHEYDSAWKDFINSAGADLVATCYEISLAKNKKRFIDSKLSEEVVQPDGSRKMEIKIDKVKNYIATTIASYNPAQKEEAYVNLAKILI